MADIGILLRITVTVVLVGMAVIILYAIAVVTAVMAIDNTVLKLLF